MNNSVSFNNSLIPTPNQLWRDFCFWIQMHENLHQCILKIKNFIVDNATFLCFLFLVYYRYFIM